MSHSPAQEAVLIELNRRAIENEPIAESLSALVRRGALRHPKRILWQEIDGLRRLYTYGEFDRAVTQIAAALQGVGLARHAHVAVALPNRAEIALIWTALSRIGAVAVGINTGSTQTELNYLLQSSDAQLLIIGDEQLALTCNWGEMSIPPDRIVVVGCKSSPPVGQSFEKLLDSGCAVTDFPSVDPDEPASILYTSGSSGRPKPALLPHRWHTMMGHVRSLQGPPVESVLIENPIFYMGGQWRFAMALTQGATVCVANKPTIHHFADRVVEFGIEFSSVSSLLGKLPCLTISPLVKLKWLASSGLPKDLQASLEEKLRAPVREIYGSTEMGSCIVMPTFATSMVGSGSCGLPSAWRSCRIVDPDGRSVAQGETGELEVRGPGMLLGYYKSHRATEEAFREGWFRTGDLFRRDSDGYYYWVARAKDVIRRSNENISAAEIESVISEKAGIVEVAAIPVPDDYRGEEIKIYVLLQEGLSSADVDPHSILAFCHERLSKYKLPRYVEYVREFPRTISQKVSKVELKRARQDLRSGSFDLVENVWR
jgi:long-chain acyl-CoA synthetase